MNRTRSIWMFLLAFWFAFPAMAQDKPDEAINKIIRKHGIEQGRVMETASWLTDVYGPRLTGSPMLDKATQWAMTQLKSWGLENVHLEQWGPFGRGWELKNFEMSATSPNFFPVIAIPKAWSPSTNGTVTGEVVYLNAEKAEDLGQYRGKLAGKIVFLEPARETKEWFEPLAARHDAKSLLDLANAATPVPMERGGMQRNPNQLNDLKWALLYDEKPLAIVDRSFKGDYGTVFVSGARAKEGRPQTAGAEVLPQVTMAVESYNRILRMIEKGVPVKLSLNLQTQYTNPDGMEHNIIAEIPGTDLKDEVVMFGGHFDSWHAGTGATDNGAGSAVMMEAARILMETIKESGQKPRRTLRIALWTGEEQGLLGSRGYVGDHFAEVEGFGQVKALKPEQDKIAGYFNLDNGTGKIRGVYLQGNAAVAPIFRAWLDAFKDLEASTLSLSNTGGTDHLAFDGVGIPGFQFIQEPMAYGNRTHHSNMDVWDHLVAEDLKQASTILASFIWHTSQRNEKLPRKPLTLAKPTGSN